MFFLDKKIIFDDKQAKIKDKLDNLADIFENRNIFLNLFFSEKKPLSLYLYGQAGCGKTTLMQYFFNSLVKTPKIYLHFNSFMRKIHENLYKIRNSKKKPSDELISALKMVIEDKKILCFDEFQVTDIADAMLLGRIFKYLFDNNIIVIFTSNQAPRDLYPHGLQREIFLEFVNQVLLKNCEIIKLDSAVDYRTLHKQNLHKRYFIANQKNRQEIREIIADFTKEDQIKSRNIKVWGREIIIKKTYEKIAIINFDDICREALAASDYQAICQEFDLIFLLKLPVFKKEDRNEMRRFMLFIDEIYENKNALIILAKTKIDKIYENANIDSSFARTISRLKEIKSDFYWQHSKLNNKI